MEEREGEKIMRKKMAHFKFFLDGILKNGNLYNILDLFFVIGNNRNSCSNGTEASSARKGKSRVFYFFSL